MCVCERVRVHSSNHRGWTSYLFIFFISFSSFYFFLYFILFYSNCDYFEENRSREITVM